MLSIKKGEPWIFWPSSICDTFPENPANKILSGEHSFMFDFKFILRDTSTEQKTVFTLVPHFTGLDLLKDYTIVTITYQERAEYYKIPLVIEPNIEYEVVYKHEPKSFFKVFINNQEVVNQDLKDLTFGISDSPHIIIGAGNFPKNDFNLNYLDIDFLRFRVYQNGDILAEHNFKERVFDKFVDETKNLNFIHKL